MLLVQHLIVCKELVDVALVLCVVRGAVYPDVGTQVEFARVIHSVELPHVHVAGVSRREHDANSVASHGDVGVNAVMGRTYGFHRNRATD